MSAPLVLLVDDYADTRDLYGHYLAWRGYRVAEAADGVEGISQAVALQPAVVVMDLAMPRMDGWAATRAIKADIRTAHIPVICLTANAQAYEFQRAMACPFDGFLAKPCLPNLLASEIGRLLDMR